MMPQGMTKQQHIAWCKARAITEMDYYKDPNKGLISLASDLRKHPETNQDVLIALTMGQLLLSPPLTRQQVIDFIDGFN